jgi:hypothetical protein
MTREYARKHFEQLEAVGIECPTVPSAKAAYILDPRARCFRACRGTQIADMKTRTTSVSLVPPFLSQMCPMLYRTLDLVADSLAIADSFYAGSPVDI